MVFASPVRSTCSKSVVSYCIIDRDFNLSSAALISGCGICGKSSLVCIVGFSSSRSSTSWVTSRFSSRSSTGTGPRVPGMIVIQPVTAEIVVFKVGFECEHIDEYESNFTIKNSEILPGYIDPSPSPDKPHQAFHVQPSTSARPKQELRGSQLAQCLSNASFQGLELYIG